MKEEGYPKHLMIGGLRERKTTKSKGGISRESHIHPPGQREVNPSRLIEMEKEMAQYKKIVAAQALVINSLRQCIENQVNINPDYR